MENSRFIFYYLLPSTAALLWPIYLTEPLNVSIFLYLIISLILFLPRIYYYTCSRFNLKVGTSSKFSDFINNIDFLKEDGIFRKYYAVLYGGFSSNNNSLWILKLTTIYSISFILIAIAIFPILGSIFPDFYSTLAFKIVVSLILLTPIVFLTIHLFEIGHNLFPVFIVIYSIVFYSLLLSSYLMFFVLLFHTMALFVLRVIKIMLQRMRIVVRV